MSRIVATTSSCVSPRPTMMPLLQTRSGACSCVRRSTSSDRRANPGGLVEIDDSRTTRLHRAEAARARAGVAQDHECRCARAPALGHVRAVGLLTDRVERLRPHETAEVLVLRAHRKTDLEP